MKNLKKISISFLASIFYYLHTFAAPKLVCSWLPWCNSSEANWTSTQWFTTDKWFLGYIWNITAELIKYVAVISVFALIYAWINYILSMWADDKAKKAQKAIVRSLIWVVVANWAWLLVNLANSFKIN